MHRIHPSPQQQKFESKYFSTSISIDPTIVQRFSPTFIVPSFVLRQPFHRAPIEPAFRIRSLIYSSAPAHARNETIPEREKWKEGETKWRNKRRKRNGGAKEKKTPRSGWIADTAFDEINLLSDVIKYLSIQCHPSSSLPIFFFFFVFPSWRGEVAVCLVRWFVTWNDAWVAIGRMQIENQYPPLHHSRTIGATTRSFETEEELHSFAWIYLWYICASLISLLFQSLLNMEN